jgi:tRNA pseudouridine55 synthase
MNSPQRPRVPRRVLDGVLLLDKGIGLSSNDALMRAKRLFLAKKAGHTGTLDPLASGLLPLCFGEATKFSQDLLDADKTYEATMRLGIQTSTGDAEGEVLQTRPVEVSVPDVEAALERFRGPISQVPPMHSALKRDGKPLYEYARAGQVVERVAREVTIHALDLLGAALPDVTFRVTCSKGTYVRTLAEDIGAALGCGAHLIALRRTGVGALTLDRAVTLEALEAMRARCIARAGGCLAVDVYARIARERGGPALSARAAAEAGRALDDAGSRGAEYRRDARARLPGRRWRAARCRAPSRWRLGAGAVGRPAPGCLTLQSVNAQRRPRRSNPRRRCARAA